MKNRVTTGWAALWLFAAAAAAPTAAAELAIIVHPANSVTQINKSELSDLYLGRSEAFGNGLVAEPLEQSSQSPVRRHFIKAVLGMDEGALKSHWSKLMFSGKGQPPVTLADDAEIREAVATNRRAIGYINKNAVNGSVKVVLIVP